MAHSQYSQEFRREVVSSVLKARQADPQLLIKPFLRKTYPQVNLNTACYWFSLYKAEVGKSLAMSENEINNTYGTDANSMSLRDKYRVVKEVAGMTDEELGEYCIKHALFADDVKRWDTECAQALEALTGGEDTKAQKAEIRELKQTISKLQKDAAKKDKEIDRKDKALATYAAKVISLKNFQKLFTEDNEDL